MIDDMTKCFCFFKKLTGLFEFGLLHTGLLGKMFLFFLTDFNVKTFVRNKNFNIRASLKYRDFLPFPPLSVIMI